MRVLRLLPLLPLLALAGLVLLAAPARAAAASAAGPGAGLSAFVLATAVVAAFLGGIGISALALRRRRTAT
jgi:hypothetical protein